jgi:hypothetical protein
VPTHVRERLNNDIILPHVLCNVKEVDVNSTRRREGCTLARR